MTYNVFSGTLNLTQSMKSMSVAVLIYIANINVVTVGLNWNGSAPCNFLDVACCLLASSKMPLQISTWTYFNNMFHDVVAKSFLSTVSVTVHFDT